MAFLAPPRLRNSAKIAGAAVAALFLLSACGGDDGEARDPIDKYIGTWKNDMCEKEDTVVTVSTDRGETETYSNYSLVFTKTSPTEASFKAIYRYYLPNDDTPCTGDAVYTITKTGEGSGATPEFGDTEGTVRAGINKLVYKESKPIGDGDVADLFEYTEAPLSGSKPSPRDAIVTAGKGTPLEKTISLEDDTGAVNAKAIAKIDGNKSTWTWAQGANYPEAFDEKGAFIETFTKQPPQ